MNREILDKFLNYLETQKGYSPKTIKSYKIDITLFFEYIKEKYGIKEFQKIETVHLREYFADLLKYGFKKRSIARKLSSLRSFYKFLQKQGVVEKNPLLYITGPKIEKSLPRMISEKVIEKIFKDWEPKSFKEKRNKLIIEMLYGLGVRAEELLNIKISDISLSLREIRIKGKGGKMRILPFGESILKAIKEIIEKRKELNIESEFLITNEKGKVISYHTLRKIIRNIFEQRAGVSGINPHILRHAFATHLLSRGADLKSIQELLGHSSLVSTEIYTNLSLYNIKKIYKKTHPREILINEDNKIKKD